MSDLRTKAGQKVRLFVDMDGTLCKVVLYQLPYGEK